MRACGKARGARDWQRVLAYSCMGLCSVRTLCVCALVRFTCVRAWGKAGALVLTEALSRNEFPNRTDPFLSERGPSSPSTFVQMPCGLIGVLQLMQDTLGLELYVFDIVVSVESKQGGAGT